MLFGNEWSHTHADSSACKFRWIPFHCLINLCAQDKCIQWANTRPAFHAKARKETTEWDLAHLNKTQAPLKTLCDKFWAPRSTAIWWFVVHCIPWNNSLCTRCSKMWPSNTHFFSVSTGCLSTNWLIEHLNPWNVGTVLFATLGIFQEMCS